MENPNMESFAGGGQQELNCSNSSLNRLSL